MSLSSKKIARGLSSIEQKLHETLNSLIESEIGKGDLSKEEIEVLRLHLNIFKNGVTPHFQKIIDSLDRLAKMDKVDLFNAEMTLQNIELGLFVESNMEEE